MKLTQELLKERLKYDPLTGEFTWLVAPKGSWASVGDLAGGHHPKGHRLIGIFGKFYKAYRLAFLYMTGEFPLEEIDHRDCDPSNNIWDNLRTCSHGENQQNKGISKNNSSGAKGVHFHKTNKRWEASVTHLGKQHYLGSYDNLELAELVATEARDKYHGQFARHV